MTLIDTVIDIINRVGQVIGRVTVRTGVPEEATVEEVRRAVEELVDQMLAGHQSPSVAEIGPDSVAGIEIHPWSIFRE